MRAPRWARALLRFLAPPHRKDDVVGDLEEAHRIRAERHGRLLSWILSGVESLDVGRAVLRDRIRHGDGETGSAGPRGDFLSGVRVSWLDFRLGLRMLVRFPGLTVVAGVAIAFAIAISTATFEFWKDFFRPDMPFEDGDRIVEVWNRDLTTREQDFRSLHDFAVWREELRSVEDLGAFQTFRQNLFTERGAGPPLVGAAVTAAVMGVARTPPALGRPIVESDELPEAPPVVLLSHEVWQNRFGSDPEVVGETVRLGSERATVIGVMPVGFGWPRDYTIWTALRLSPVIYEPGEGPPVQVVGRLAEGVSLAQARAEVEALGGGFGSGPGTEARTKREVGRYGSVDMEFSDFIVATAMSLNAIAFIGLVILVAGNVALLIFARTAARHGEIVVRSALGASRSRIVAQLFAETLVLAGISALVGLAVANRGLEWAMGMIVQVQEGGIGTWFHDPLTGTTIAYALVVTLVASVVSGVLPALKATSGDLHAGLQRAGTGGARGPEAGRLWGGIIVAQIAVTVAFVPLIIVVGAVTSYVERTPYGFPAEEFLMAEFRPGGEGTSLDDLNRVLGGVGFSERYRESYSEVKRRLELEPEVLAATLVEQVPGGPHGSAFVEVEGAATPAPYRLGHYVTRVAVDRDFFTAVGAPFVAGRGFRLADADADHPAAVVDENFLRGALAGRNAIGRRIRFNRYDRESDEDVAGPWHEIVGVVSRPAMSIDPERRNEMGVYVPLASVEAFPVRIAVHTATDPIGFASTLRQVAAEVDPGLTVTNVRLLSDSAWVYRIAFRSWFWVLLAIGGIGVLLATSAIYSIMAFTVSRRTREIGVRVALGADWPRVMAMVLRRTARQIGLGTVIGAALIGLFLLNPEIGYRPTPLHFLILVAYLALMAGVCGLACVVPTARALGVEPTEALRAEG